MKHIRYLLFLCLLTTVRGTYGQDVKLFLITEPKGATDLAKTLSKGWNYGFGTELALVMTMQNKYPCVAISDGEGVVAALNEVSLWETPEFGSHDISDQIAGAFETVYRSDYYLLVSVYSMSPDITDPYSLHITSLDVDIKCLDKHGKAIIEYSKTYSRDEVFGVVDGKIHSNEVNKPVLDFIKELDKYEICPFTGPVNIEVKSNREETTTSSTQCDAGLITTDVEITSNSDLKWELQKEDLEKASGTVTYDMKENYKTTITNSCYVCKDGTKGFAKIIETTDSEAKVQGLSNESVSEGAQVSDARIKLVFLDDGTYFLQVKATSEKGPMKVTTEKKVDGPCTSENENEPPDTKNKSIDVPITAVFGPYKGTPQDKVLSQKETKDVSQGKEQSTVTIDFSLSRE